MINLSLNELKLIAQIRNISDYENKSKEDLIKALSEPKPEIAKPEIPEPEIPKPEIPKPEIPKPKIPKSKIPKPKKSKVISSKPETPKPEMSKPKIPKLKKSKVISSKLKISKSKIPKPKPRPEIRVNKKKLKKLRKDFDELRHKFSNKDEIKDYRKAFHIAKNYKHLFESEIKKKKELLSKSEIEKKIKHINKLKRSLKSKTFQGNIDSVDFKDLYNYNNNYDCADDDK